LSSAPNDDERANDKAGEKYQKGSLLLVALDRRHLVMESAQRRAYVTLTILQESLHKKGTVFDMSNIRSVNRDAAAQEGNRLSADMARDYLGSDSKGTRLPLFF